MDERTKPDTLHFDSFLTNFIIVFNATLLWRLIMFNSPTHRDDSMVIYGLENQVQQRLTNVVKVLIVFQSV